MNNCKKQIIVADLIFKSGIKYSSTNYIINDKIEKCSECKDGEDCLINNIPCQLGYAEINVLNMYKNTILGESKEYYKKRPHLLNIEEAVLIVKNLEYISNNNLEEIINCGIKNVIITNGYNEKTHIIKDRQLIKISEKLTYGLKVGDNIYLDLKKENSNHTYVKNRLGVIKDFYFRGCDSYVDKNIIWVGVAYEDSSIIYMQSDIANARKV